jgi:hypothetical protein
MWQAEAGWHPLPGGTGASTVGVWRTVMNGRPVVVKRLSAPRDDEPAQLRDPHHVSFWKRPALVASAGTTESTPGLRSTTLTAVEEDADGITITQDWIEESANSGLFLAHALGRFAGADLGDADWLARNQLRDRMARVERRGGWTVLARTTVADVAGDLWHRRHRFLDELDALPQVAQHGDPVAANLLGRVYDDVLAIDWATLGHGPVGADLGHLALGSREAFEPLLEAYVLGLPDDLADPAQARTGAQVAAVLTAMNRADWALGRVAGGEGALSGKYRHPAVAPHLRTLQRQLPLIEALLES